MLKIYDSDERVGARCELKKNHTPPSFPLPLSTDRSHSPPNLSGFLLTDGISTTSIYITVCLHSAFQYPGLGGGSDEVRESFEVRAMVFDSADDDN